MVVLPEPLVGAAIIKAAVEREKSEFASISEHEQPRLEVNAGFMLQKYKIIWKMLGYSENIRNFARKYGNQAAVVALTKGNPVRVRNCTCSGNPP